MLQKLKNTLFSFKDSPLSLQKIVKKTKANVLERQKELDFDLLGRSLSCNPYLPRANMATFNFTQHNDKKIIYTQKIQNYADIETLPPNLELVSIDTTLKNDLSLISICRRYTPYLILHKDIFISKYQILESAVFGADMILLDERILGTQALQLLCDFASHLGLVAVVRKNHTAESFVESCFDFIFLSHLEDLDSTPHAKFIISYKNS